MKACRGQVLAAAVGTPVWADPTPTDTEDPAYQIGYTLGRLGPALCCLLVLIGLSVALVVLLQRRRSRRAQRPPHPPQGWR